MDALQAKQPSPRDAAGNGRVVSVPIEDGALLVLAVIEGEGDLERAVVLRGAAARLFVELGSDASAERMARELTTQGNAAGAAEDARRFRSQLARGGLAEPTPGDEVNVELSPARAELGAADVERLARAVLDEGFTLRYRALGRSMRPAIPHGSRLEVVASEFSRVRVGDVILYSASDGARLVAHRVRGRGKDGSLRTRGDSSARVDHVRAESFLGLVRARQDGAGQRSELDTGRSRCAGLVTGALYGGAVALARVLLVGPLRRSYGRPSALRALLGGTLRVGSGVLLRIERWSRSLRRPVDVTRSALLSTAEKDEDRRRLYARRAVQHFTSLDENLEAGLTPIEEVLFARHPLAPGKALVLGCGPGREAVELAARGFEVTGMDREEGMLARGRSYAARRGVELRFVRGDALDFRVDGAPFDVVVIFSGLVNMILPRARREGTLACAREHLSPGGRVLVTFLSAYRPGPELPSPRSKTLLQAINPEHEPGDHYLINETVHVYPSAAELCAEAEAAGLEVEAVHRDQRAYDKADGLVRGFVVLRRPS